VKREGVMRKKRSLKIEEKKILIKRIADFLETKEYILFAYIFGSFIAQDTFSDIDIGIFIANKQYEPPLNLELNLEIELQNIVHIPVDVRILNHAPLSFVYNVLKNMVVVVDKNKTLRADFEGLIFKKYFDFKHLRDEYLREIVNAPV